MSAKAAQFAKDFASDARGTVMVIFGLMALTVFFAAGMAMDFGRVIHVKSRLSAAADAASLAAGRALLDGRMSDAEIKALALQHFDANMDDGANTVFETIGTPDVAVNRATGQVTFNVDAVVPMTLTKIAGFTDKTVSLNSATKFDQRDVELSMALDLTGSMGWGSKLSDLKGATNDLIDILLPDGGSPNKVRIAFAPYSSGVNAGIFADAATGQSSNGCTFEREGTSANDDAAPGPGRYLKVRGDAGVPNWVTCPTTAPVVPLSDDKDSLKATVNAYTVGGSTAGHLGTQWGWFLLSPNWASILSGDAPAPYNDGKTVKAMVLMTDGLFNTVGGQFANGGSSSANAQNSMEWTVEMCEGMRNKSIMVFTVGFALGDISNSADRDAATEVLQDCAGNPDRFFNAENGPALRSAFAAIAQQLNNLRLTN